MRIATSDGFREIPVRWFFADDLPVLKGGTPYGSINWRGEGEVDPLGVGEVVGASRRWVNGRNPNPNCCGGAPAQNGGAAVGGRAEYFLDGIYTGGGGGLGDGQGVFLPTGFLIGTGGGQGDGQGVFLPGYTALSGGGLGNGSGKFVMGQWIEGVGSVTAVIGDNGHVSGVGSVTAVIGDNGYVAGVGTVTAVIVGTFPLLTFGNGGGSGSGQGGFFAGFTPAEFSGGAGNGQGTFLTGFTPAGFTGGVGNGEGTFSSGGSGHSFAGCSNVPLELVARAAPVVNCSALGGLAFDIVWDSGLSAYVGSGIAGSVTLSVKIDSVAEGHVRFWYGCAGVGSFPLDGIPTCGPFAVSFSGLINPDCCSGTFAVNITEE